MYMIISIITVKFCDEIDAVRYVVSDRQTHFIPQAADIQLLGFCRHVCLRSELSRRILWLYGEETQTSQQSKRRVVQHQEEPEKP